MYFLFLKSIFCVFCDSKGDFFINMAENKENLLIGVVGIEYLRRLEVAVVKRIFKACKSNLYVI